METDDATGRKVTDVLTADEIRVLTEASDFRGWLGLATDWGMIAGCFALVAYWPSVLTVLVSLVLLGGRMLGLSILMHDASHRALFKTRWLNDWVGEWFCAAPVWSEMHKYRKHHLTHHSFTNTDKDTDLGLVAGFPTTRRSLLRKVARDLSGITGLKRIVALAMMDAGIIGYTASVNPAKLDQTGRTRLDLVRTFLNNAGPTLITNFALYLVLRWTGNGMLYLLWVAAYLTTFSLIIRVRSMAEHACTPMSEDPFRNTRTTRAGWLARVTVAPHFVNYHLEHHLLMTVPHHNLPKMHALLRERGCLNETNYASSYWEVLRKVSSGPEPSVSA